MFLGFLERFFLATAATVGREIKLRLSLTSLNTPWTNFLTKIPRKLGLTAAIHVVLAAHFQPLILGAKNGPSSTSGLISPLTLAPRVALMWL